MNAEKTNQQPLGPDGHRIYVPPRMKVFRLGCSLLGGSRLNGGHNPTNLEDILDMGFGGGGGTTTGGSASGSGHADAATDDFYEGAPASTSSASSASASAPAGMPASASTSSSRRRVAVSPLANLIYGTAIVNTGIGVGATAADDFGSGYEATPSDSLLTDPLTSLLDTP
ncbi:MAG: hypothetical protein IJ722_03865 [Alloprevotella sp.]|nr:hypothetical protein [Alloprevotella sp.]